MTSSRGESRDKRESSEDCRERNREIVRLYAEEGRSLAEVGDRFRLSRQRVQQILKRAGVSRRSRDLSQRNQEIARLYADGDLTLREIGERFNMSRERVGQIARRAGVTPRVLSRPRVSPQDVRQRNQDIIRLYAEGLTLKEIAARFSLTPNWVSQILEKANVNRRRDPAELVQRNEDIIRAYLEDGLTRKEVARRFGISPSAVHHILGKAGVRRR